MQKTTIKLINLLTLLALASLFTQGCYKNLPTTTKDNRSIAEINSSLAIYYLENQLVDFAKYKAIKALELQPKLPVANLAMAHYLAYVGEYKDSEKYFLAAIRFSNNGAKFLHAYGNFICEHIPYGKDSFNLAIEQLNKAAQQIEYLYTADLYASMAYCYAKNNYLYNAKVYLNKAIAHKYNNYEMLININNMLSNKNQL